jgi:hypothetical protein
MCAAEQTEGGCALTVVVGLSKGIVEEVESEPRAKSFKAWIVGAACELAYWR